MARKDPCAQETKRKVGPMGRGSGAGGDRPGAPLRRRPIRWDYDTIAAELAAVLADWPLEKFPARDDLHYLGLHTLASAVSRHGGFRVWALRMGYEPTARSTAAYVPYGWDEARQETQRIIDEYDAFPGIARLAELGYPRLRAFIQKKAGGRARFLEELGYGEAEIGRLMDRRRRWRSQWRTDGAAGQERD